MSQVSPSLETLRHSAAHLLAQAVQRIHPTAQVAIGPVTEEGFFYDFAFERPFTAEDLPVLEQEMRNLAAQCLPIVQRVLSRADALALFAAKGEHYKVEIVRAIPETEVLTCYAQGTFEDLCRGPHLAHTGQIQWFKLLKVAGAYWRGDPTQPMLTRIYGTAFTCAADLEDYLARIAAAEARDHRVLAQKYDLFHLQEEGPGMIFWHPKGMVIYQTILDYMRNQWRRHGYQEVRTPQVLDRTLWEQSGHWGCFGPQMFSIQTEDRTYALKPMNCPGHVQLFTQGLRSYRDLPLRLAEFGVCHRNEPSGSLHGAFRLRQFVQDDAHIFCTEAQIQSEVQAFIALLQEIYRDFGFQATRICLATRPEVRVGSTESWDKAEHALAEALRVCGLAYTVAPGEGAFYGPKIEFHLKDALGRSWQCGTLQVDFSMPERLHARYVNAEGERVHPVMLHRAVLGALERFIGILIEEYAGDFPLWLAPVQVAILTVNAAVEDYATALAARLEAQAVRVVRDFRNEKIGFKIREHTVQRVPYLLVIGAKEQERQCVAMRTRTGVSHSDLSMAEFETALLQEIAARRLDLSGKL